MKPLVERQLHVVRAWIREHWLSILIGILAILHVSDTIKVDGVGLALFFLAFLPQLLPLCSKHLKTLKASKEGIEATFNFPESKSQEEIQALPEAERTPISDTDIVSEFKKIPELGEADIRKRLAEVRYHLLNNGIATRKHLERLVSSKHVLDALRTLYVKVLRRDPTRALDPVAVAAWGPPLSFAGPNEEPIALQVLEARLRQSDEYRDKVAQGIIRS